MKQSDMSVRTARFAAALLGVTLVGVLAAPMAGAADDPYGSTTTTTSPVGEAEASCGLSVASAKPGADVTGVVHGVFFGEHVRILFDGVQVAEATAPADPGVAALSAAAPVAFGGQTLAAQAAEDDGTTDVTVAFKVPKAAPGKHVVTAVGDTFTCFCNPRGEFTVLAAGTGTSSLARTGVEAGLVLVIALALLLVGRAAISASRRRRPDVLAEDAERQLTSHGR